MTDVRAETARQRATLRVIEAARALSDWSNRRALSVRGVSDEELFQWGFERATLEMALTQALAEYDILVGP